MVRVKVRVTGSTDVTYLVGSEEEDPPADRNVTEVLSASVSPKKMVVAPEPTCE